VDRIRGILSKVIEYRFLEMVKSQQNAGVMPVIEVLEEKKD
jgi:hypothetical protein